MEYETNRNDKEVVLLGRDSIKRHAPNGTSAVRQGMKFFNHAENEETWVP